MGIARKIGTAADLLRTRGLPMKLRLDGDADDPLTWHQVAFVHDTLFHGGCALTVEFYDGTPEKRFKDHDPVEFALRAP